MNFTQDKLKMLKEQAENSFLISSFVCDSEPPVLSPGSLFPVLPIPPVCLAESGHTRVLRNCQASGASWVLSRPDHTGGR